MMPAMIWLEVSAEARQPMAVKADPISMTATKVPIMAPGVQAGGRSVTHSNILN